MPKRDFKQSRVFQLVVLACLAILLSSCASNPKKSTTESRVVVAASGVGEIIKALDLNSIVVGFDGRNSVLQESSKDSEKLIAAGHNLNIEKLISVNPNLVFIDEFTSPTDLGAALAERGIETVNVPTSESLSDVTKKILLVGKALGVEDQAKGLADSFNEQIKSIAATRTDLKVLFLYLRGSNSIYLVGGKGTGANSLIEAAGGIDIGATKLENPFTPLSAEVTSTMNPDVLLVMAKGYESVGGYQGLRQLPGLSKSNAMKYKQIIEIDDQRLLSFSLDSISVIQEIATKLASFKEARL